MLIMKLSLLFSGLCCFFLANAVQAQCNEPAVALSANANAPILVEEHTLFSDINYVNPSTALPNVEFIVVNKSLSTADGIQGLIVGVSETGAFQPSDYNIGVCDEFSITPISYNLPQLQSLVDAILTQDYVAGLSCCASVQMLGIGLCNDLADLGITSGSDIQSISDLFSMVEILTGTSTGLNLGAVGTTISMLNSFLPALGACNGGITELCYAMDTINNDHYAIRGAALNAFEVVDTALVWYPMTVNAYPMPDLYSFSAINGGTPCPNDFIYTSLMPDSLEIINNNGDFIVYGEGVFGIVVCHKYETALPCDTIWIKVGYHELVVAINELNNSINPIIYPNPAQTEIIITFEQSNAYTDYLLTISDLAGRMVYSQNIVAAQGEVNLPINISNLANGMYVLTLANPSVKVSKKIMKH